MNKHVTNFTLQYKHVININHLIAINLQKVFNEHIIFMQMSLIESYIRLVFDNVIFTRCA
jgi:hypothetical protein